MSEYHLSERADADLLEIAIYTIKTWGPEQADRYEASLRACFAAICDGRVRARTFLERRPEIRFCRCEYHYVFFLQRENACPLILAVFHEKMDLMARLRRRLEDPIHGLEA